MKSDIVQGLTLSLAFVGIALAAQYFRYEVLPEGNMVWDRWGHRICLVRFDHTGVACTREEFETMRLK
jgi:hypothetical protein